MVVGEGVSAITPDGATMRNRHIATKDLGIDMIPSELLIMRSGHASKWQHALIGIHCRVAGMLNH